LLRLKQVQECVAKSPHELSKLVSFSHPNASPAATGALIATEEQISDLRASVLRELGDRFTGGPIPQSASVTAAFDHVLGRALHGAARLLPADAAHRETWNFLSAMVFPDVVWARFPNLHEDRFLGRPRNALRRVWFRQEVLGELLQIGGPSKLGEDILVGLLERTSMSRNRRLVKLAAQQVISYTEGGDRSVFARDFYKRLTHLTGPLLLDALSDEALAELVGTAVDGTDWRPAPVTAPSADASGPVAPEQTPGRHRADVMFPKDRVALREKDSGDIVRQFHDAMEALYREIVAQTDYRPKRLLALLSDMGGLEAARRIAGSPTPSDEFIAMWDRDRLDLSVEALVLQPEFAGLFPSDLLELAERRIEGVAE
jgi:hypothetical protein